MRVVQLIDSLEAGGAERMAVTYANSLSKSIEFSGLVATRKEGVLKESLFQNVTYLFLNRKKTFDFKALYRLKKYCIQHNVEIIHAHSSSYFIAILLKLIAPQLKIVWHDHNGVGVENLGIKTYFLKIASLFFLGIISVNTNLKEWAEKKLYCKNVLYLSNYITPELNFKKETQLLGISGKRILCLANLRKQKNHEMLLTLAEKVKQHFPDWTFHCVGKDFKDDYSKSLFETVAKMQLQDVVFFYDSKEDIYHIITQSDIGILTSLSEGLPVSLLEYGLFSKPVVCTSVGQIPQIIENGKNGYLAEVNNVDDFFEKIKLLISNKQLANSLGLQLYQTIEKEYLEDKVLGLYQNWLLKMIYG